MPEDQAIALPPVAGRQLVTFALFAYNQEKYIREAVEGALAQTYEPLEIILSDDCSNDRTFDIILEVVRNYKGPHKIILNKNSFNLGISRHIQKIYSMSSSELIVHAAGDDISHKTRVAKITSFYESMNGKISLIGSNGSFIDENGKFLGPVNTKYSGNIVSIERNNYSFRIPGGGFSFAARKSLYLDCPPADPEIIAEDELLMLRANLEFGMGYIDENLVGYRIHHESMFGKYRAKNRLNRNEIIEFEKKWTRDYLLIFRQIKKDSKHINCAGPLYVEYINELESRCRKKLDMLQGDFLSSLGNLFGLLIVNKKKISNLKLFFILWLPWLPR